MSVATHSERSEPAAEGLGIWPIALRGLLYYRGMLWPVALGVAAATAVIVGALLVGDSVRGSLRYLALDRLGKIEHLLMAPRFFERTTLEKWARQSNDSASTVGTPLPVIVFPQATIERSPLKSDAATGASRSGTGLLLGITQDFWELGDSMPSIDIGRDEVVLNQALADELGVTSGDKVTLRLPAQTAVPADSPLGRRDSETVNLPGLKVLTIIENRSIGRFDIRSNQRPSNNAFVALETIQEALSRDGQINAAVLPMHASVETSIRSSDPQSSTSVSDDGKMSTAFDDGAKLLESLPLSLADMGYKVTRVKREFPDAALGEKHPDASGEPTTIFDYFQITSDQMLIPDEIVDCVRALWPGEQSSSILTYLANNIRKESESPNGMSVTYSTLSAIDPSKLRSKSVGFSDPSLNDLEKLDQDEVIVNSWLAIQLDARIGDRLRVRYYLPETVDGHEIERSFVGEIAAIVPLTEPESGYRRNRAAKFAVRPTAFNDPALTPEVPGITDQDSMSDWDLPFRLTQEIPPEDDDYWTNHRLTPKLFLPLTQGQVLFGSRFGSISSIRLSTDAARSIEEIQDRLAAALRPLLPEIGWQIIPVRAQQLAASRGTTPFDVLFLSLSFFVILAALILVSLLFRLAIERRASQWGLLLSLGWPLTRVRYLLAIEGLCMAIVGGLIGVGLGILYASGVLYLLHSWWVGAVGAPFLTFFMTTKSLLIGLLAGIVMASLTIWFATRFLAKQPMVRLLRGRVELPIVRQQKTARSWTKLLVSAIFLLTVGITILGLNLNGQASGGAFVGAGMLALMGMLVETMRRLRKSPVALNQGLNSSDSIPATEPELSSKNATSLWSLAVSSIRRQPMRTTLAIGLVSVATLLILSMSLFEAVPDQQGTGGFQLMAESSVPIGKSFSDRDYLRETLGDQATILQDAMVIPLRVRAGDDAGCNNLYQASQPRVLGISPSIVAYDKDRSPQESFAWAGVAAPMDQSERISHWRLLERDGDGTKEHPYPVMIDQNTALWALHLTGGVGQSFAYSFGKNQIHFVTVGLLQNTILQGSLILGEKNFNRAFPQISGYRSWLIHCRQAESVSQTTDLMESGWSDEGMDVIESNTVLKNLLAVQNTYLKAFQSLGALGLLLGTFGLAVVQLRSVMERQPEFGLLRAIGFTRWRVGSLILLESLVLLAAGLGIGCIAAAIALLPTLFHGTIHPNFLSPTVMLGIVALCGVLASLISVRRAMKLKLLQALRSD